MTVLIKGYNALFLCAGRYGVLIMKMKLTFILIVCFVGHLYSQKNIDYGLCTFEYENFVNINPIIFKFDSIDKTITENIATFFKMQTDSLYRHISFVRGQELKEGSQFRLPNFRQYYDKKINYEENYFYNLPKYEFLFKISIKQVDVDYCFNIHTNTLGKIVGEVLLPNFVQSGYPLISKTKAIILVQNRWKNKTDDTKIQLAYNKKKKCFAWVLSRSLEMPKKGFLATVQYIVINAHNGHIIENRMENVEFN